MDGVGLSTVWGVFDVNNQLFCFVHVQLQVVISAPLCEVRNGDLIGCNGYCHWVDPENGNVIRALKYVVMGEGLVQSLV